MAGARLEGQRNLLDSLATEWWGPALYIVRSLRHSPQSRAGNQPFPTQGLARCLTVVSLFIYLF